MFAQLLDGMRRHPIITGVMVVTTAGGAVAGGLYCPEDWSLVRAVVAGTLAGFVVGIFCTAPTGLS